MRYALGARSSRIVRQLLIEGGLLGAAGAAGGLALSPLLAVTLVRLMTSADPGSEPYSASVDGRVLLFALGLSMVVSVLFSIAPALHFLRPDLAGALRQSTGTASKSSQYFRKAAVGVQIALSVLLLGGAGLFVRTLEHLRDQPVGFDTRHLATFNLDPTISGYGEDRTPQIIKAALDGLRRIPGVRLAAATTDPELMGDSSESGFVVQGHKPVEGENTDFEDPWITPGYFATIHQPLLVGRDFTEGDGKNAAKVAIVNLAFVKQFYGSAQNALGRLIGEEDKPDTTIVGVVGDVKHQNLRTDMGPAVYRPYAQIEHPGGMEIYLRTAQDPETAEAGIQRTMHDLDPTLVVDGLRTMEAQVDISASDERALAMLALGFAVLAALLAAVGLYGVLAYSTQSRTREIGVRLALGARREDVLRMILRRASWLTGIGVCLGLVMAYGLARLLSNLLRGVRPDDPIVFAGITTTIVLIALLASWLPARRAARIDPMVALRDQ